MGGCISHDRNAIRQRAYSSRHSATTSGTAARNKPLNHVACRPKWKSDVPITESQLRRKREEYWDTAPAFEGRKEIWDALRGACAAIEQNDFDLAQSILNCANISLPQGTLFDCYDELGTRYQLPIYVLSPPINIIDGEQSSVHDNESVSNDTELAATAVRDRERDYSENQQRSSRKSSISNGNHNAIVREIKKHRRKQKPNGNESNSINRSASPVISNQQSTNTEQEIEIPIKFRLSNGKEHRLYCRPDEKIRNIKRRLAMLENGTIDCETQRLFFGGKLLFDRTLISELRLQRNFVVQVILKEQSIQPNGASTTTSHSITVTNNDYHHSVPIELPNTLITEHM